MGGSGYDRSGYDFEVRPALLAGYAEVLRAAAAELATVGEALGGVRVERGWFGKLPQSEFVADRYAGHREAELAAVGELGAWVADAAEGLRGSAGRYSAADRVVVDVVGAVEAGRGVGIEGLEMTGISGGAGIGSGIGEIAGTEIAEIAEIAEPGGALG